MTSNSKPLDTRIECKWFYTTPDGEKHKTPQDATLHLANCDVGQWALEAGLADVVGEDRVEPLLDEILHDAADLSALLARYAEAKQEAQGDG